MSVASREEIGSLFTELGRVVAAWPDSPERDDALTRLRAEWKQLAAGQRPSTTYLLGFAAAHGTSCEAGRLTHRILDRLGL